MLMRLNPMKILAVKAAITAWLLNPAS